MNKYIQHIILFFVIISIILMILHGCMRNSKESKHEFDTESELKYEPVKVEMPQDMSALYQELGFEYSTIEEAEYKIVAELDSSYDKDNQTFYVPEVVDMELTDRYNLYRFNGKKFEYIGDNGGFWLHPSIREFQRLELLFSTKDYKIRIDVMNDDTYRYTSWKKGAYMSEYPDLIILNGTNNEDDGNYYFENNGYTYCIEPDLNNSQLTVYHESPA